MIYDNFLFFLKNPSSTAKTQNPAVFIIKSERPFIFLKIKTINYQSVKYNHQNSLQKSLLF